MKRSFMMKKIISAFVLTVFLSVSLSAAEAAPPKKGERYPHPPQQQSQQNNRPPTQQPRPGSPHPSMQHPRPGSPRPSMQRPKAGTPRPSMQQPRPGAPRPSMQHPKAGSPRPSMQRPKAGSPRPSMQHPRPGTPRPSMQQPKAGSLHPSMQRPRQNTLKRDLHNSIYDEHRKPGPRKDLHRPPVQRTDESVHVGHSVPKPPKSHWWDHRPAHRMGRYRGYYNGIYCRDVLSALLAAEIVHYNTYDFSTYTVTDYADCSARDFIPKEAIKYKRHHYLVFSDIGETMEDAQQFCESIGGHLATVGDDGKNERLYRLINDSGYDSEYFEKFGHDRMIPNEPVTYVKVNPESNAEEDAEFYGLYYWNYKNLREDGTSSGTGGNAFVCEWDV